MANMRFQPVANFTGGLNLRPDQLQLTEGEFPYCRNVDIDPRGGVVTRPSWKFVGTAGSRAVAQAFSMNVFRTASFNQIITCSCQSISFDPGGASAGSIYYHTVGGSTTPTITTQTALGALLSSRNSGGVGFAQFGTLGYLARGASAANNGYSWSGAAATSLSDPATTAWQDSFASPTGTHMPIAEHVASHMGYLWVACTYESANKYNRVRFSHPNFPQSWRSMDWIDIEEGGPVIRGIIPFGDMLVVLKDNGIFAILGYDVDTFQVIKLSTNVGCVNAYHAVAAEDALYFLSPKRGVFRMDRQGGIKLISEELSPLFQYSTVGDGIRLARGFNLSFSGGKLRLSCNANGVAFESYVSNPFGATTYWSNTAPSCVFAYDPMLEAWTIHTGGHAAGLGLLSSVDVAGSLGAVGAVGCVGYPTSGSASWLSFFVHLDGTTYTGDDYLTAGDLYSVGGTKTTTAADVTATLAFTPMVRTPWIDGGNPAVRKRWLRPELATRELTGSTTTTVRSFRDFDETTAVRSVSTTVTGSNNTGAAILRSGPIGTAKSVQLLMELPTGVKAGLLSAILKYVPRQARA